ncbi:hypothetical protein ACFW8Z_32125, partial [Streptomyces sp. NPDC059515]
AGRAPPPGPPPPGGAPPPGPVAGLLSRGDLLRAAGLRLPWGVAAGHLLRTHGLLTSASADPRTPEELAALADGTGPGGRAASRGAS